ncbi:hypothetical protein HMPREF2721_09890 [Staphylococcus sp. HMSC078A12]|uniref:BppU family phage baseplate upper protein n=1 Tax=Staphylococcus sp. HMSC078A12 TaxID=1715200 RepID=UPI0008A8BE2B|nr:BppU family phage baseplate upper protein [Staphylococcus sp. HMSC078A12]OHR07995.1 hypothetical protein HMPREF2721_09890 [Staphylococcus sp. HMSC078A12]
MLYKNKDINAEINLKNIDLGDIKINFYTEDKGTASIRVFINWNDKPVDLNKINMRPLLNLYLEDGSVFEDELLKIVMSDKGIVQYNIPPNVIRHAGKANAKLFLVNENESIHAVNFSFNIIDSGIETPVRKELSFNLVDESIRKIVKENALTLLNDSFKTDVETSLKDYLTANSTLFKGEKGEIGDTGSQGVQGLQGEKGEKGEPGDTQKLVARNVVASGENKPLITFVDDDGRTEVLQKWEPVLKEKGNKLTIPLITQWMDDPNNTSVITWDDVHRLKNTYGVEFVSHTHTHQHANTLTAEQIKIEFSESKRVLMREGLTHNIIVQPYGENTADVRRISRNYFKANIGTRENINVCPFDTFNAYRITLGEATYTTFEQYKAKIDEAITNNGWLIFKSHSQYTTFDDNQIAIIKQIIDYARQNGMVEVNLEEGLELFGNLIDVGDYTAKAQGSDYYIIDKKGQVHSNKYGISYRSVTNYGSDINSPVTNFDYGLTHEQVYSTRVTGFPENKAGTLQTYRSNIDYYSFQIYYPYDNNNVYKRIFDRDLNTWGNFEKQNADYIITSTKNSLNSTPVAEFNTGITKEIVQTVNATGFPENKAGILETNKLNPVSYCYQLYYIYNSNRIYKRFYDSVNNWTAWERVDNTRLYLNLKTTVNVEVPPNSSVEVTISMPGVTNNDNVVATPVAGIEQGLMYNAFINTTDSVRIRFYNYTSSAVVTNRPYKIDIIKPI